MIRKLAVSFALIALPFALVPGTSHAGAVFNETANCSVNAQGAGACWGTLPAFRSDSYFDSFAEFDLEVYNGTTYPWIEVNTSAGSGACVPPSWMLPSLQIAINHRGYFYFSFDGKGNCSELDLWQASFYAE
jgi:hypothetical protein